MNQPNQTEIDRLKEIANRKYAEVMRTREEIMTAFVANFQMPPDQIVQVEWRRSPNEVCWFLVKKGDCIFCEKCKEQIGAPADA